MFDRLAGGFPLELSVNFNWQIFAWLFVQFGGIAIAVPKQKMDGKIRSYKIANLAKRFLATYF